MLKIENAETIGWEHAIRGMRNPFNSWNMGDTRYFDEAPEYRYEIPDVGPNDLDLMKRLRSAGTDHRKFMRMIAVYADITAPLYWWKEFDTYKVGTVANSCSTMHKIADKEFTLEDFSCEHLIQDWDDPKRRIGRIIPGTPMEHLCKTVEYLNRWRERYLVAIKTEPETGLPAKDIWWQMIQLLPSSYNQRRTVMLNYEVLANIYKSRRNHKLDEWHTFCDWIKTLPYSELITREGSD